MNTCQNCQSKCLEVKRLKFFPKVREEVLEILADAFVCSNCQHQQMDAEQINALRRASVDQYRKNHDLLVSSQIIHYRSLLGMSQSAFAAYLSVGEASIKRWETYYIQDKAQDEHIRLKCDSNYAQNNLLDLSTKYEKPNLFNGKKSFSLSVLQSVKSFAKNFDPTYANTFYFYVDFLHFKKFGRSVMGMKYLPMKCGPCSYHLRCFLSNVNIKNKGYSLDEQEKETVETVSSLFRSQGEANVGNLVLQEKGYKEASNFQFINYQFAKDLLI